MSKYLLFFCLLLVCIRPGLQAQVTFELNPFEKAEPFKYQPIRSEFWNAFADKLKLNQIDEAVSAMSSESFKKLKDSEKAELYLALAESAEQTDHPYLAILLVSEITHIFPLSNQAIQSYFLLEDILKKYSIFDDLILGETIVEQDINLNSPKIPPEIRSFLGYVLFQSHRQQGFTKWEKQAQKWITPDSEWAYRLEYDRALYELFNDRFDNSLDIFQKLMDNEKASDYLRKKAKRQVARLIFEKGEFQKSFEMLKSLQFEQDDRGAILLERAWNKYYLKHYSKALGLLTALDSPIFEKTRTPETDILKMLIYKELCHYDEVFKVKKDFDKRYKKALDDIKNRRDLTANRELMQMTLMRPALQSTSQFIGGLRRDYKWFASLAGDGDLLKDIKTKVELKDKQLQDIISLKLNNQIRKTADEMLDWAEQVNFLDYQTRVDSLRLQRSDKELNYRPEAIPLITFDNLYWLYEGEMWLDELENLRVLVQSKCEKTK